MAVDRWFIGGGAEHTPESARRLVYASTSGAEGVGGVNDLRVLPLAVPGQGVRVTVGSALIRSRYVGGETQTYMGTVYSQETVSTTPTGSGGKRSDLVVMRVEDPFAAGSPYPEPAAGDIPSAPYIHIRVISGVPANTKKLQDVASYRNDTAVTLARIDYPASTGTVTAGMITDLREVAQPRRSEVVYARPRISADDTTQQYLTGNVIVSGKVWYGEYFPGGAGSPNQFTVRIPEWATRMVIDASWMSIQYDTSKNPGGRYWIEYGDEYRAHTWPDGKQFEFSTQQFAFGTGRSTYNGDGGITNWLLMDEVGVPAKLRGKEVTFVYKAGLMGTGIGNRGVWMNATGGLGMRITFAERAIDSDLL